MTYNELKTRLSVVEKTLKKLQTSKDTKLSPTYIKETVNKLTNLKESIENKLTLIKEEDGVVRTTDSREAEKLTKRGVNVDLVDKIEENEEDIEFTVNDMKVMITQVGKALAQALVNLGDELARVKAHRLETNSFDIHVIYKGERAGTDDEFAFHIEDGNLHLADFSFNKKLVDVGVKPSGEAFVNVDVLKNELMKHFKSLNEEEVNEGTYQTTYIKVKRRDYKKAIEIIDSNIDSTFVTTDIVDDDGDGNVIIYFNFRDTTDDHRPGFETDNAAFIYDLSMDLKANDIEIMDHSHDLDSDKHMNEFIGRLAKWGASKLKAAGMSAVRGAATGALKGAGVLEFVGKELEDRNEPLWKELVPGSGKAETVEGEMLRAINRMVYRFYNDGDKYFEGYGAETAGPAHAFLIDANHPLKSAMNKILDEPSGDASYERMLKDALDMILDHIESKQGKYTPNNVGDMFDYDSYFEDEEEDDDDYTYDYDDEEDDDYYNEEGLNEEDISKRKQAVKLIRQTLEDEGGAAGLAPLVKAVKGLGFDKEGLLNLLRKTVKVEKHKHGDYILTPINEKKLSEGTELYEDDKVTMKRFAGPGGPALQITKRKLDGSGWEYIQIKGDELGHFANALMKSIRVFDDMSRQLPVDEDSYMSAREKFFQDVDAFRKGDKSRNPFSKEKMDAFDKKRNKHLKEYTDHSFTGGEVIDKVRSNQPDMFDKETFVKMLPNGADSELDAHKALVAHDKSPIKGRMGEYAPMFVHLQYHEFEFEGVEYQLHQQQYYNNNFADKDSNFNPKVTVLTLFKDPKGENKNLGRVLVKTDEYVKDLKNLNITKRAMQEQFIVTGKKGKGEAQYGEPYKTREEAEAAMKKILKSIKGKPDAKFSVRKGPLEEALQLVHVYDKDGKIIGTGSVQKVEGDKTTVRFDGNTVKRFPSDRVKPVKEGKYKSDAQRKAIYAAKAEKEK